MLDCRIVSSLEKPLIGDEAQKYPVLSALSALRGERANFQFIVKVPQDFSCRARLSVDGIGGASVCEVVNVTADLPAYTHDPSRGTAGFIEAPGNTYPDLLQPLDPGGFVWLRPGALMAFWVTVTPDAPGVFTPTVTLFTDDGTVPATASLTLTVPDAALPAQETVFTEWFHCDCLASYYGLPVFSEAHWRVIENFMRCAVDHGINCLLTPVFTPPLDTERESERPTVQLVGVRQEGETYTFDFSLLARWIRLARSVGVRYFEISHFFTQWGAECAPKVVAETDEGPRRIFGWDTPGTEGAYPRFLQCFLPELTAFLQAQGVWDNCYFHVSDEPSEQHLEGYCRAKAIITPYLKGCKLIDALCHVEFYRCGAVELPVPATDFIEPFLAEDIPERWAYYCCGQIDRMSNRFIAYPGFRNRILGVQLYKFGITGFLQWGYNFYYSMGSRRLINPYVCQSGEGQVPSGDAFSVYPGPDGQPLASTRLEVFYEALEDIRALQLCESLVGRETVVSLIDELAGAPVTFAQYPQSADYILTLRERVNALIASAGK